MFQRAFFAVYRGVDLDALFRLPEGPFLASLNEAAGDGPAAELLAGLFGPTRRLYKRLTQYSLFESPELYGRLARRPYPWLVRCSEELAAGMSRALSRVVAPHEVLFDAPPTELEVEFDVEVRDTRSGVSRRLGEISPMVKTLAREQFDDYVKRVRVFIHPRLAEEARGLRGLEDLIHEATDRAG